MQTPAETRHADLYRAGCMTLAGLLLTVLAALLTSCTAARPSLLSDTTRTERAAPTHIR